jgi:hypothetical protein
MDVKKSEQVKKDLALAMNVNGIDSVFNLPDYVLADYLFNCLANLHTIHSRQPQITELPKG